MQVQVLQIRTVGKGLRIAHIKANDLYGDAPATEDVKENSEAFLRTTLGVRDGRLQAFLRVEKLPG